MVMDRLAYDMDAYAFCDSVKAEQEALRKCAPFPTLHLPCQQWGAHLPPARWLCILGSRCCCSSSWAGVLYVSVKAWGNQDALRLAAAQVHAAHLCLARALVNSLAALWCCIATCMPAALIVTRMQLRRS
jgi:hypothetical protein